MRWFRGWRRESPTILVAEDLHWADASTLEAVRLLVSSAPELPLLGLFTARPEFRAPWFGESAAGLIEISRLGVAEVEAMARAVANGKRLPGELMRVIAERSDGVPLFVEEVARAVIESGVLAEQEFSWELTAPLPADLIPATVDGSSMARIDNLGDARPTAQLAATIGREFSWTLLQAVSDRSEAALGEDLQRLLDSGLAWPTSSADGETYASSTPSSRRPPTSRCFAPCVRPSTSASRVCWKSVSPPLPLSGPS